MWGSTTPNTETECTWKNAPFNGGNTSYSADAFNLVKDTACPNDVLAKEYDAASQIMGGVWRMPTNTEIQELLDNTTKELTQVNGVNGCKFTSNKEGYQNNSIFIPASGYRATSSFYDQGGPCRIWSSSINTSNPDYACSLYTSSNVIMVDRGSDRRLGYPVRGVRK